MTFFYDLNKKLDGIRAKPTTTHQKLSEGKKPDFLDLDKDGDKTEPMKKAAKEKTVEEGSTGDYSAKKAAAGKDIGKPGKNFSKIADKSGGGEKGKRIAGAVLAKLRGKNESVEEAKKANKDYDQDGKIESGKDEYLGSRIRAAKKSGKMKEADSTGLEEGWDDMIKDVKQRAHSTAGMKTGEKKRSSTGGEIEKTKTGLRHTAGKQYGGHDHNASGDDKLNRLKGPGKAGRPKGPDKGPERVTANATKHKGGRKTNEGDNVCPHCGHELVDEESTNTRDNHAERAGRKVTKDLEYDMGHKGKDDAKAERAGRKVSKDIEYDEKKKKVKEQESTPSKGGMSFGKGIYDSLDRQLENMINESINMSVTMSKDDQGEPRKTISVTAEGADADKLAEILSLAGINGGQGDEHGAESCSDCGQSPCGCDDVVDENAPDWPTNPEVTGSDDPLLRRWAGGLNGPKSTGQTTVPVIAHQGRQSSMESADIGMKLYAELKQYKAK